MFDYNEIEKVVREQFDPTFDLSILLGQNYSNDCAVPYGVGENYEDELDESDIDYDAEEEEEIHYNNIAYCFIDEYMISKGATKGQKVWIDVTW